MDFGGGFGTLIVASVELLLQILEQETEQENLCFYRLDNVVPDPFFSAFRKEFFFSNSLGGGLSDLSFFDTGDWHSTVYNRFQESVRLIATRDVVFSQRSL
jgi:hypothetical protein